MKKQEAIEFLWKDYHPFDKVSLGRKYFPNKHFSEITIEDINEIVIKENPNVFSSDNKNIEG